VRAAIFVTLVCSVATADASLPREAPVIAVEYARRGETTRAGRYPVGTELLVLGGVWLRPSPASEAHPEVPIARTSVRVIGSTEALVRRGARVDRWYHVEQRTSGQPELVDGWIFGGDVTPFMFELPLGEYSHSETIALRIDDDFRLVVDTIEVPMWWMPPPPVVIPIAACSGWRGGSLRAWQVANEPRVHVELRGAGCASPSTMVLDLDRQGRLIRK
jgi:hypothetical protein